MSKTKVIECDDDDKKTYKHLNAHSVNPYMDALSTLFQRDIGGYHHHLIESIENLIKWDIHSGGGEIRLEVFKKINAEWELINTRIENYPYKSFSGCDLIYNSLLLFNNDIVILTTFGILIYTFNENNKSISLNYFYHMNLRNQNKMKILKILKRTFSKSTLPLPNLIALD
ncbi:hypothetical protein RhiirA4_426000 [Rhizophagus irregularis]|uniref:Uncharacterized protein n=1 Tax=Rhizophagus irregularis TaxID=588596 RepID=A0A2I1H3F8_9GLOM|nr:hypothetical protein RhiirA4_426000 [Rhizophagus irregularis]